MELTLSELQEMATRQQQQIEAQQQMLVAKVGKVLLSCPSKRTIVPLNVCPVRAGAAPALPEAAGAAAAAGDLREREAAETEGARGEPGGQVEEDPCDAGPGGLQQGHQRQPV